MLNCKELHPVIQVSKLSINSVDDVEWLPTHYQVEPVNTDTDDDQVSIISISSNSSEESVTSLSTILILEVEPFISSDNNSTLVGSDSDFDQFESISDISDLDKTDTASESEI